MAMVNTPHFLFNWPAEVISVSKMTDVSTEGCLSFPLLDFPAGDPGLMFSDVEVGLNY